MSNIQCSIKVSIFVLTYLPNIDKISISIFRQYQIEQVISKHRWARIAAHSAENTLLYILIAANATSLAKAALGRVGTVDLKKWIYVITAQKCISGLAYFE